MKKHISVFMLMARSSIYRVFFASLATAALQLLCFYLSCSGILLNRGAHIEDAFSASLFSLLFAVGLFAVTFFLCRTGWETSSKTGYTLKRLSISEKQVYLWQAVYNTLAYLFYWLSQVLVIFALAAWYTATQESGSQTAFMLFFRSAFIRGCWPMEDAIGFVRNVLFCVMLGITSARYPMAQRNGKRFGEIIPAYLAVVALWNRWLGSGGMEDFLALVAIFAFTVYSLSKLLKKEEVQDLYEEY